MGDKETTEVKMSFIMQAFVKETENIHSNELRWLG